MQTFQDNTPKSIPCTEESKVLRLVANQSIDGLLKENPNLLVFPQCLDDCEDDLKDQYICSLHESVDSNDARWMHVQPTNIVGYFGVGDTNASIISRFSNTDGLDKDYFLHYLLQKALSINIFNLEHSLSKDDQVFDFLMLLFPGFFKQALAQGLYKEYRDYARNDANVKGRIDVNRHLNLNVPFSGKVAYQSREISYDNNVTELIRHTIEFMRTKELGRALLNADSDVVDYVRQISASTPAYSKKERSHIIRANLKPAKHPYFTKYRPLQNLCVRILRHESIRYGEEMEKVHGILFDMSWLWEEYLATLLPEYTHPKNRKGTDAIYLGEHGALERYPDFYYGKTGGIVLDAKYKRNVDRNDEHQIIAYMYRLQSRYGGFLMPRSSAEASSLTKLKGYGQQIGRQSLVIPQDAASYDEFCSSINQSEGSLINEVQSL